MIVVITVVMRRNGGATEAGECFRVFDGIADAWTFDVACELT